MRLPSRHLPPAALAISALALLLLGAGTASAATSYLRPNADLSSSGSWSPVGAGTAWGALADNVTEAQAPANASRITSNGSTGYTSVGLTTMPLAGATGIQMTAWVYTANANQTIVDVLTSDAGSRVARGYVASPGWNSIPLAEPLKQENLDDVTLRFLSTSSLPQEIYAAFLAVTYTPSPPRVYWGSWIDGDVYGGLGDAPWNATTWNIFQSHAGRAPSIVHFGQPAPWIQAFAAGPLELTKSRGAIPLIDMSSNGATLAEIASGAKDSYLATWANAVRNYRQPFFLRWNWEMNGTWFPWGKEAAADPSQFKDAWRHFHDVAEARGATNITWVWCPNTRFSGSTALGSLYPGDDYVDWTCVDGYNRGTNPLQPSSWVRFYSLFAVTYSSLLNLAPNKPVMIGETASTEFGGSKSDWIDDAFSKQLPTRFPQVKAVNWFNWNISKGGGRWDWPIESSAPTQAAFSNVISSPYYAGNAFGNLPNWTRIQPLP